MYLQYQNLLPFQVPSSIYALFFLLSSESESKTIQDRITAIERHLGQLCDTFGSYTRKTARLRDKGNVIECALPNKH